MTETTCSHENYYVEPADPSVGIMCAAAVCEDCGEDTIDFATEDDYDRDVDGYVTGGTWQVPVW